MASVYDLVRRLRTTLEDFGGDVGEDSDFEWETDDTPLLWSNRELVEYLNEAHIEHMRRAEFFDASSSHSRITLVPDCYVYPIHKHVQKIRRITRCSDGKKLERVDCITDRMQECTGEVEFWQWDKFKSHIIVAGTPDTEDVLQMELSRLPCITFDWDVAEDQCPEIDEHRHIELIDWALHLAYLKEDPELQNLRKALYYEDRFERHVGPRRSSHLEELERHQTGLWIRTESHY